MPPPGPAYTATWNCRLVKRGGGTADKQRLTAAWLERAILGSRRDYLSLDTNESQY